MKKKTALKRKSNQTNTQTNNQDVTKKLNSTHQTSVTLKAKPQSKSISSTKQKEGNPWNSDSEY